MVSCSICLEIVSSGDVAGQTSDIPQSPQKMQTTTNVSVSNCLIGQPHRIYRFRPGLATGNYVHLSSLKLACKPVLSKDAGPKDIPQRFNYRHLGTVVINLFWIWSHYRKRPIKVIIVPRRKSIHTGVFILDQVSFQFPTKFVDDFLTIRIGRQIV